MSKTTTTHLVSKKKSYADRIRFSPKLGNGVGFLLTNPSQKIFSHLTLVKFEYQNKGFNQVRSLNDVISVTEPLTF